jgi:hypothetical protein
MVAYKTAGRNPHAQAPYILIRSLGSNGRSHNGHGTDSGAVPDDAASRRHQLAEYRIEPGPASRHVHPRKRVTDYDRWNVSIGRVDTAPENGHVVEQPQADDEGLHGEGAGEGQLAVEGRDQENL